MTRAKSNKSVVSSSANFGFNAYLIGIADAISSSRSVMSRDHIAAL